MRSIYVQNQMTDEHERWTLERCIKQMERDVVRGNALQRLIADEKAALLSQPKLETENERHQLTEL